MTPKLEDPLALARVVALVAPALARLTAQKKAVGFSSPTALEVSRGNDRTPTPAA